MPVCHIVLYIGCISAKRRGLDTSNIAGVSHERMDCILLISMPRNWQSAHPSVAVASHLMSSFLTCPVCSLMVFFIVVQGINRVPGSASLTPTLVGSAEPLPKPVAATLVESALPAVAERTISSLAGLQQL